MRGMTAKNIVESRLVPTPDDLSRGDLSAWYSDCVVLHKAEKTYEPYKLIEVNTSSVVLNRLTDSDQRSLVQCPPSQVYGYWPQCGAVNLPQFAVHVERRPRRQWRRSYTKRSVAITIPGRWLARRKLPEDTLSVRAIRNDNLIKALFYPSYPDSLEHARHMLREAKELPSVALSRHLTLISAPGGQEVVFYGTEPALKIDSSGHVTPYSGDVICQRAAKLFGAME